MRAMPSLRPVLALTRQEAIDWLVDRPLRALLYAVAAWFVSWVLRRLVVRFFRRVVPPVLGVSEVQRARAESRAETLATVVGGVFTVLVWFVAVISILEVFAVNLGPLLAGAGVAGVALGFGAQNVVRDSLAGTFMILEDQLGVGDVVDLGEARGTVEKVTLRCTRLRDVNGTVWYVPNGQIVRVGNKSQDWARALLDVEVDVDQDVNLVRGVLERTAEEFAADPAWSDALLGPPEVWGVETFTARGYTVRLVLKTRPGQQFDVMRELRVRIKEAFTRAGVRFPSTFVLPPPTEP